MSALPLAAAARAITRRHIERPLRGNQREPPPTGCSIAARLPLNSARSVPGWLLPLTSRRRVYLRYRNRSCSGRERAWLVAHLNRSLGRCYGRKFQQ